MDDRPFGGGEGMVLKPEPIFKAVEAVRESDAAEVVVLSASGRRFNQAEALRLSKAPQVILICGRYEGIDERVAEHLATAEISIGDFILSGGEIGAALIVERWRDMFPELSERKNRSCGIRFRIRKRWKSTVEHPHYTRPAEFRGWKVPEVLISGDHEAVRKWRAEAAMSKTARNRPDLLNRGIYERNGHD